MLLLWGTPPQFQFKKVWATAWTLNTTLHHMILVCINNRHYYNFQRNLNNHETLSELTGICSTIGSTEDKKMLQLFTIQPIWYHRVINFQYEKNGKGHIHQKVQTIFPWCFLSKGMYMCFCTCKLKSKDRSMYNHA